MNTKLFFLSILIIVSNICNGQSNGSTNNCDKELIYRLVNCQVKIINRIFINKYFIDERTGFHYMQTDDTISSICNSIVNWDKTEIHSKKASVVMMDSLKFMSYYCSIDMPVFNRKKTRCRIRIYTHQSEWGGFSADYYYREIFGIWIKVKRIISAVS